ncbi:MAG TPA: hypothetical protein VFH78_08295 [Candidatus Thermoplasmatota archaeon]|nr:hypothetical protein [Candidatus Thermoplasmatota archaeon]
MRHRKALLLALLVVMPAFAGCNVKDWYNQMGTVRIQVRVIGDENSLVGQFQSVKVALYGVTLRQAGDALNPKFFSFGDQPKIVDLVTFAREGEEIPITEFRTNLRATERVQLKVVVIEAIDAAGNPLEICRETSRPARFPCFFQYTDDALYYEKPFSPPRGGEVIVHFPIAVKYASRGAASQYFLFADPALVELENRR